MPAGGVQDMYVDLTDIYPKDGHTTIAYTCTLFSNIQVQVYIGWGS